MTSGTVDTSSTGIGWEERFARRTRTAGGEITAILSLAGATDVITSAGRYVDVAAINPVELLPGLEFRPVLGERAMVNVVHFAPRTEAPHHVHEEEHIVVVLEGEMEFDIDGDVRTMRPGDIAVVPSWVPHGAHTLDSTCREIHVFSPPRKSLLDHARAQMDPGDPEA